VRLRGVEKPFLLRIYKSRDAVCEKEREIHRLVGQRIPVPEFYDLNTRCEIVDRPFAFIEWIDGVSMNEKLADCGTDERREIAAAAGGALADIHRFSFDLPGFFGEELKVAERLQLGPEMFLAFIEDCLSDGKAGHWLGPDLSLRLGRFARENANLLAQIEEESTLVHSDFNAWNLLLRKDRPGRIAAVLDWEFAFSASGVVDIGNMLRYEKPGSDFETHFIKGYVDAGGKLPDEWRKLSKLTDLVALCDLLNRSDGGENRINDLKGLIYGIVSEWDQL
jgi:aminoglycoside phosphotransferase (APT) family kinase protein